MADQKSQLSNQLDNLAVKLSDLFSDEYTFVFKNDTYNVDPLIHHCYNNYWYPRIDRQIHYFGNSYVTNNFNNYQLHQNPRNAKNVDENDKQKKKDKERKDIIFGAIIITGTSFLMTWVLSSDGYVNLWRYGIKNDIDKLEVDNLRFGRDSYIEEAIETSKRWLKIYSERKKNIFIGKMGMLSSMFGFGASVFLGSDKGIYMNSVMAVASSCYYLWKKWEWNDITYESHNFKEIFDHLNNAHFNLICKEDQTNNTFDTKNSSNYPDLYN